MEPRSSTSTSSNFETARTCVLCAAACSQCCSVCNKVAYCSKEHQKAHWKTHKTDCFPAEIKHNQTIGRHLVATRYIKQGQTILKEKPLVSGPNCGASYEKYYPLCLSCFRIVKSSYFCTKCKWPMCGLQCETMKNHARNECRIFSEHKVAPFSAKESFMYEKIIILRALLCRDSDANTWSKLADLESHSTERNQGIKGVLLTHSAVEFIQEACGLHQFTNEEIDHVVGALATNAFWNNDNTSNVEVFRSGSYLFYYGSLPAHSCSPNSAWTIQMNSEFHLRAAVDICAGEPITQLYTEATTGTLQRRSHLKETKYFLCSCERCDDPTELKTYFSAIKCPSCSEGYLLPILPLNEDSDWICQLDCNAAANTSAVAAPCGKTKSRKYVDELLEGIRTEINHINEVDDSNEKKAVSCITSLKQLTVTYASTILHPNHFLIYEAENIIIQRISYLLATAAASDKLTVDILQLSTLMVDICRKSFRVTDIILPGWATHRGRLLYFLQQGLTTSLYAILSRNQHRNSKQKSGHGRIEALKEIEHVRFEAKEILSAEPEGREEFMLHKFLSEPSERLKFIQKKILINVPL